MDEGRKKLVTGILMVTAGAASYGMLASMVALAYRQGYATTEVLISQYAIGLTGLAVLAMMRRTTGEAGTGKWLKLVGGGTTLGLVGYFYYTAVRYIPVSVAVVLLMQSIWISVVLEAFIKKRWPGTLQVIAIGMVLAGTVLATNAINNFNALNWRGLAYGMGAGLMYALMLLVVDKWGRGVNAYKKSFLMLAGGMLVLLCTAAVTGITRFKVSIFWKWGVVLALFGTILPPVLMAKGIPRAGVTLSGVLIAVEIPVSVLMAHWLLGEQLIWLQWAGIIIILLAVILMNYHALFKGQARNGG